MGFLGSSVVKICLPMQEMQVQPLVWEDPLEKEIVQYSDLEHPMDKGAYWATVHRATKSWTWLSTHRLCLHPLKERKQNLE